MPRAAPADQALYRHHFRAPVRFNQESATIVFPARDLDLRIAGADPLLRAMLEERIQQLKGAQGSEFSDDIRRLLRTRLTSNHCSADDIAHLLTMHRRTLSRRLKDSGMGYRAITNEIRFEIARQLLQDTKCRWARLRPPWAIPKRAPSPAPSGAGRARRRPPGGPKAIMSDAPRGLNCQGIVPTGQARCERRPTVILWLAYDSVRTKHGSFRRLAPGINPGRIAR